jgi:peptidyl-prolyl cis-trans isomerase SurA
MKKAAFLRFFIFLGLLFLVPRVLAAAVLLDRVVAVVNSEVITWSELYKMMEYEAAKRVSGMDDKEKSKVFKENEAQFLQNLIDMRLQLQEARKIGVHVSKEEISEAIGSIKNKYSMTDESFKKSLEKEGLTIQEYEERLKEQMIISQFVNRQIKNKIVVTEEEVDQYMSNNNQDFQSGDMYRISQIFFETPEEEADRSTIEEKAESVYKKLEKGEDFSDLAKHYSEDSSRTVGGDLGFIQKDIIAKEFLEVLLEMNVGDYSQPFWTSQGMHIIKLEEIGQKEGMDQLRENARNELREKKFLESYRDVVKSLREKAHIELRL